MFPKLYFVVNDKNERRSEWESEDAVHIFGLGRSRRNGTGNTAKKSASLPKFLMAQLWQESSEKVRKEKLIKDEIKVAEVQLKCLRIRLGNGSASG
jgi:hypothetical protein